MKLKHYVLLAPIALLLGCSDDTKFTCNDKDALKQVEHFIKKEAWGIAKNEDYIDAVDKVKTSFDNIQTLRIDELTQTHACLAEVTMDIDLIDSEGKPLQTQIWSNNIYYNTFPLNNKEKTGTTFDSSLNSANVKISLKLAELVTSSLGMSLHNLQFTRAYLQNQKDQADTSRRNSETIRKTKEMIVKNLTSEEGINKIQSQLYKRYEQNLSFAFFGGNPIIKDDLTPYKKIIEENTSKYSIPSNEKAQETHDKAILKLINSALTPPNEPYDFDSQFLRDLVSTECQKLISTENFENEDIQEEMNYFCKRFYDYKFYLEIASTVPKIKDIMYPFTENTATDPSFNYLIEEFILPSKVAFDVLTDYGLIPQSPISSSDINE